MFSIGLLFVEHEGFEIRFVEIATNQKQYKEYVCVSVVGFTIIEII